MIFNKNKSKYFPPVFSSLMLALSLIASMVSNVVPFIFGSSFLRVDIGIAFISFSFMTSGWKYGLITLLCNFMIHPFLPGTNIGFIELFFVGKTIFLITCLLFVFSNYCFKKLFKNKKIFIFSLSSITTTIIIVALNGMIFTPIFFYLIYNKSLSINFLELMEQYQFSAMQVIFIVPNYWGGIILVYGAFNIFSLTINSLLLSMLINRSQYFY